MKTNLLSLGLLSLATILGACPCASAPNDAAIGTSSSPVSAVGEAHPSADLAGTWGFVLAASDVAAPIRARCAKDFAGDTQRLERAGTRSRPRPHASRSASPPMAPVTRSDLVRLRGADGDCLRRGPGRARGRRTGPCPRQGVRRAKGRPCRAIRQGERQCDAHRDRRRPDDCDELSEEGAPRLRQGVIDEARAASCHLRYGRAAGRLRAVAGARGD